MALTWAHGLRIAWLPQVRLTDGQVVGAMVSADLIHPRRGLLQSSSAMPVVRELGLELLFFYRVVARVLLLQRRLLALDVRLSASIRASAIVLTSPEMPQTLERWTHDFGVPASLLRIELDTGSVEGALGEMIDPFKSLQAKGFGLSVEEFSVSNAMIRFITSIRQAQVKIGAHLVARVRGGDADMAMVGMLIKFAKTLGLDVVAEGVESQEQACQLHAWGCDMGEGPLFDVPLVVAEGLVSINAS